MKISVVIPFNKYKFYLKDCLESLSLSTYKDFETILVLDHCQEDIADVIETYGEAINLRTVTLEDQTGVAAARNKGIEEAQGEYVYLLDSDDYVLENTFSLIAEKLTTDIVITTRCKTWNKRINFLSAYDFNATEESIKERKNFKKLYIKKFPEIPANEVDIHYNAIYRSKNFFTITALGRAYKKEFLDANNIRFDESFVIYGDIKFVIDCINAKPSVCECLQSYYVKRRHNDPYNYPSVSQGEKSDKFPEQLRVFKLALDGGKEEYTKHNLQLSASKYISRVMVKNLRRSTDDKWKNHYYKKMQPIVAQFDSESFKNMKPQNRKIMECFKNDEYNKLIKITGRKFAVRRIKNMFDKKSVTAIYKTAYFRKYLKEPIQKDVVMFESFFGKSYSDSPKYIYEYLAKNYGDQYKFVWSLNNDTELPYGGEKVKRFSLKYAYYLATAKYLVFNVRQPKWYRKREGQVFLETWHGTPLKKLVFDQEEVMSASATYKIDFYKQRQQWDYLVSANSFSTETLRRCFMFEGEMLDYGYPRNDILYAPNKDELAIDLKKKLGIPLDKKTILYAPTWRDDEIIDKGQYSFNLVLDLKRLKEEFSDEYVLLLRTHYYIADKIDVTGLEGFVYNLSTYNDISEIYLISDICMTDYSSVFFDYGNLKRPELFFVYDYEKYRDQLRGFYISMEDDLPGPLLYTNDDVVDAIKHIDEITEKYKDRYEKFYNRFCDYDDGNASKRIVERVFNK